MSIFLVFRLSWAFQNVLVKHRETFITINLAIRMILSTFESAEQACGFRCIRKIALRFATKCLFVKNIV